MARGGLKDENLVACGQRSEPAVGRQDAELGSGAARQVLAARCIFVLRVSDPKRLSRAALIQRHQLTICS